MGDTKKMGCGGCLGIGVLSFVGLIGFGSFLASMAPRSDAPVTNAISRTPEVPSSIPAQSSEKPQTSRDPHQPSNPANKPVIDSDAGKLRGTKSKDWDHTWVSVNGKKVMAIYSAVLSNRLTVGITYPLGVTSAPVDQLPQGFLDSWGITGDKIDQMVNVAAERIKTEAQYQVDEARKKADAELDAQRVNMGFKVVQVVSPTELLGVIEYQDGPKFIHISGIDTSNVAQDQTLSAKVWRDGVFRYTSVLGASSQIESYTALRPQ